MHSGGTKGGGSDNLFLPGKTDVFYRLMKDRINIIVSQSPAFDCSWKQVPVIVFAETLPLSPAVGLNERMRQVVTIGWL